MTRPSSQRARPPTLWPPPRIAVSRLFARPKLTAVNDIGDAGAAGDESRPFVDARVPDLAGVIIAGVLRLEHLTAKCGFK